MDDSTHTLEKTVSIVNELGLHARAAAKLAAVAGRASGGAWLISNGQAVDATSVIDILTLACSRGMTVTLKVDAAGDIHILEEMAVLVNNGFGE